MNKIVVILLAIGVVAGVFFGYRFYKNNLSGVGPAVSPPKEDIAELIQNQKPGENNTDFPLKIADGFIISVFAKGLESPRDLEFDPTGALVVSIPSQGRVVALKNGSQSTVVDGLRQPHGIAFNGGKIYIAETNAVAVYDYDAQNYKATNRKKIIDLPSGAGHSTRSILIRDEKLYVSTGSSCNVCVEDDPRRAAIWVANLDGSDFKVYAYGLRNSVFLTLNPKTNEIWATEMGRDLLGDDTPPDEINVIRLGSNYGWPFCYGNKVRDTKFNKEGYLDDPCSVTASPVYNIQAHSAPLGLAFLGDDLLVSFHGSWNRTVPTGYKVVRFVNNKQEDFITGWLSGGAALGRPVDIIVDKDGSLYISDDKAGVVYLVSRR